MREVEIALPPDCLELLPPQPRVWRGPSAQALRRLLAVGSYRLDAASGAKTGALDLLQLPPAAAHSAAAPELLLALADVGGAVLDARWLPARAGAEAQAAEAAAAAAAAAAADGEEIIAHLCAVTSAGCLEVHALALSSAPAAAGGVAARQVATARLPLCAADTAPASALAMSFFGDAEGHLAISRSDGCISLCSAVIAAGGGGADTAAELRLTSTWRAHSHVDGSPAEVWAVASPPDDSSGASASVLWSGADDALLKVWDVRAPARPQAVCRMHRAGVCNIAFHPTVAHLVATGSYDEELRLWDARALRTPLASARAGGGVWKLKWRGADLLAACMQNGAAVFRAAWSDDLTTASVERRMRHAGHGEGVLVYGVEWLPPSGSGGAAPPAQLAAASCAFYARTLQAWEVVDEPVTAAA